MLLCGSHFSKKFWHVLEAKSTQEYQQSPRFKSVVLRSQNLTCIFLSIIHCPDFQHLVLRWFIVPFQGHSLGQNHVFSQVTKPHFIIGMMYIIMALARWKLTKLGPFRPRFRLTKSWIHWRRAWCHQRMWRTSSSIFKTLNQPSPKAWVMHFFVGEYETRHPEMEQGCILKINQRCSWEATYHSTWFYVLKRKLFERLWCFMVLCYVMCSIHFSLVEPVKPLPLPSGELWSKHLKHCTESLCQIRKNPRQFWSLECWWINVSILYHRWSIKRYECWKYSWLRCMMPLLMTFDLHNYVAQCDSLRTSTSTSACH